MSARSATVRYVRLAALCALLGLATVARAGQSPPPLPDAVREAARQVVLDTEGDGLRVAVMPADSTDLSGYAAALLPIHLREAGREVTSLSWERRSDLPPGIRGSVSHRLLALAGEDRCAVLVDCRQSDDAETWKLRIGCYGSDEGKRRTLQTTTFTVPDDLSLLLSNHHNGLEGLQLDWFRLMKELFPTPPENDDLDTRLRRTAVRFFFRRGRWAACAARLENARAVDTLFLRRVMALELAGESNAAADLLESTLADHSGNGPLHLLKAWTVRRDDPERASKQIEKGRFADVEREGYYHYGRALLQLERQNYDDAEEALLEATNLLQDETFVQLKVARFYWDRAKLDLATKYFRRAAETDGDTAAVRAELGSVLAMAGKVEEAIEQLQAAAKLNPWRPNVAKHLSKLFERRGEYSKAIQVLRRASKANSHNPDFLCAYGDAAAHRWLLDEAIRAYRQALEADPGFPYAKVRLARALARRADYSEACNLLTPLVEKDGQYVPAAVALGRVLTAEGRTDEAAEVLSGVATESDAEVARRLALSRLHLQTGNQSEAIRSAQIAVSIQSSARTYAALSRAFLAADEVEKAAAAAEKARNANPYSAIACLALARVSARKDNLEKAATLCREALELDPYLVQAMKLKGDIRLRMNEPQKAAAAWEKALELDRWHESLHWQLAELLRTKVDRPGEAAGHYRRVAELGGPKKERAAKLAEKLEGDDEPGG